MWQSLRDFCRGRDKYKLKGNSFDRVEGKWDRMKCDLIRKSIKYLF